MKRKTSPSALSNDQKKRHCKETQLTDVINLGIPHVGEQIFEYNTDDLIQLKAV